MANNNPTNPLPQQGNKKANNPKPIVPNQPAPEAIPAELRPVPLRRVGRLPRIPGVIVAPTPSSGGKRRTRRKHKKARKSHRRRR
jgi:hypothetical protein